MTFGVIVFVILVVGAWLALRELGAAAVHKVTSPQPSISLPKPPITVTPPTIPPSWSMNTGST